ncbi:hypothetical protein SERN_0958 [Serinibacter arcticus]|uniref:Uncharacterized protein n=1 Tax=Serinibacter arcticus TaxID=1655435 RepID=A0A4Z1E492_9MICO|nr:hypothetical protein SERN_0958 [Serinibacter arcticus]
MSNRVKRPLFGPTPVSCHPCAAPDAAAHRSGLGGGAPLQFQATAPVLHPLISSEVW